MHVEKWLREMSSIPETDAPIKQALAHGLLLHLKNIYPVFPESLVRLLLSVLDVKTYRDDARLNEWISKEGANKQVISSQADSLIKISRIWADFFPANTSNQPI